jgi:hypothetical protein
MGIRLLCYRLCRQRCLRLTITRSEEFYRARVSVCNFQTSTVRRLGPIWAFAPQKEKNMSRGPDMQFLLTALVLFCLNAREVKLSVVCSGPSVFVPQLTPDECLESSTYICILERDQFFHPPYSILCIYSLIYLKIPNIPTKQNQQTDCMFLSFDQRKLL